MVVEIRSEVCTSDGIKEHACCVAAKRVRPHTSHLVCDVACRAARVCGT